MLNTRKESFEELLEESLVQRSTFEGTVVKGIIVGLSHDMVVVDVGLKSEGKIPLKDFALHGRTPELKVGDTVDVYVERVEDRQGEAVLSVEKARREAVWGELEKAYQEGRLVNGVIFGKVRGGFAVDLSGAMAFLPGSQVDVRPIRDISPLMNITQPFKILKMDKLRNNIVVSRRAVLEESRAEQRSEVVAHLSEGQIVEGVVKNITDYGAFVDLGGIDGLLHVTDISWKRVNNTSEVLHVGQKVKVQIVRFNRDTQRISLGMKQLGDDPWKGVEERYIINQQYQGIITNVADYGAFVELEPAVEGLIYVSEMSWTKKNFPPNKLLSPNQKVTVMVLDVDTVKRRISLGLKQCMPNPWEDFATKCPVGAELEGAVRGITEFGLFIAVNEDLDGMVHMSDLSWDQPGEEAIKHYKPEQMVKVKVLDIDPSKERISLGIKQLGANPMASAEEQFKKGRVVTGTVSLITDKGIELSLKGGLVGTIRKNDLSRDQQYQRTDRFAVGEKVDAQVLSIDRPSRRINLSIKALELSEEKKALDQYGSSDSGASLGDILGAAIHKAQSKKGEGNSETA